jgi:solute carrier family 25 carnitine/acylcarnitine transporter 20/29
MNEEPGEHAPLWKLWTAGAIAGLATWVVSAPSELVKCRVQLSPIAQNSWGVTKDILKSRGIPGLYYGGVVTSLRDSVGYGF